MKKLAKNQKCVISIFITIFIVLGANLTGYADITPVSDRTPQVRDAIVAAVPNVNNAANVTAAHLAAISSLNLRGKGISALKTDDFSGLTGLTSLNLYGNQLSNLPDGIFEGLTSLTTIRLGRNAIDPLPLTVSLENVGAGAFKAVAPAGALFDIVLPITVTHGSITEGATTVTIPQGNVESRTLTVIRAAGTTAHVTVGVGTFPNLPRLNHYGYALVKSDNLPLVIIRGPNTAPVFSDGTTTIRSVAENAAIDVNIGSPVSATDADKDTLTYSLSGIDASPFSISSSSGQLQTRAALDYETKTFYSVTVAASDEYGGSDSITVIINVIDIDENRAPVFIDGNGTTRTIAENTGSGQPIGSAVSATDADNDTLTYTLSGDPDAASFSIDSTSGQLQTKADLDFEKKTTYTVTVTVSDGTLTDIITVTINVTDTDETISNRAPVFTEGNNTTRSVAENTDSDVNIGNAVSATDADNDILTYTLSGDPDAASFGIDSTSGQLQTKADLDFEIKTSYSVMVTVSDGNLTDTINVFINVIDVNDTPIASVLTPVCDRTPQVRDAIVGAVQGIDNCKDVTEAHLSAITSLNLSARGISALKKGDFDGLSSLQKIELAENQLRSLPTEIFSGLSSLRILYLNKNQLILLHEDIFEGLTSLEHLYLNTNQLILLPEKLFDGLVSLRQINLHTNKLKTLPSKVFSGLPSLLEIFLHNNQLTAVPPEAFSGLPLVHLHLHGNRLMELPSEVFSGLSSLTSLLLNNNQMSTIPVEVFKGMTASTRLWLQDNTVDPLPLTVSLEKVGTNQFKAVVAAGAPFTLTVPISVANGDISSGVTTLTIPQGRVESVPLSVTRASGTSSAVTVDIGTLPGLPEKHQGYKPAKSANLPLTVISSPGNSAPVFTEGSSTTRSVAENTGSGENIGTAVTATDADNDTLTYTLGGTDAASFSIDSTSGQLQTNASLDYETKNAYTVTITVSDGSLTDTITVFINVTDIDETIPNRAPVFTEGSSTTRSVVENTGSGVNIGSSVSATDADGDTLTYTLGGTDAASFGIFSTSGQLQTKAALDYETKTTYTVAVTVSDGTLTDTITVTINVTDIDETIPNRAPVFTEGSSTTRSVAENTGSGVDIGSSVSATDADGDTLTYTLGGTDAASFGIFSTSGQLQTKAALDYETKTTYTVAVTVSDGTLTDTITVTINVTDIDETIPNRAPVFTEGSSTTRSVAENTGSGVDIGSSVSATDADGDTLTYTLGGTDAASFGIDRTTGQLRTKVPLDYEAKTTYTVTVTVSDGTLTDTITVTINVTDIDETIPNRAPVFTEGSSSTRSVAENTGSGVDIGTAVSATDADGDPLTYTLGGTDAASFNIVSTSGQLQTKAALDYETKTTYTVAVTVSDGTLTDTITVTINVTDIDETIPNRAPVFTEGSSTTRSVAENIGSGVNIGTAVSATDADGDTLTYTLSGTDAASFGIVSTSGQLQTKAALDYETKNTYHVSVTVSDGSLTDTISVTITVTQVIGNLAPVFTEGDSTTREILEENNNSCYSTSGARVGETVGTPISATDANGDILTYTLGGTDAADFDIDSTNGQLTTKAELVLDYETKNAYALTVSVSDGNGGSDSITVTINITDYEFEAFWLFKRNSAIADAIKKATDASNPTDSQLASIKSLSINNVSRLYLYDCQFDGLSSLTNLDLSDNYYLYLSDSTFQKVPSLTDLDLSNCNLYSLPSGIFKGLTSLDKLNLSGNGDSWNRNFLVPIDVQLKKVAEGQFKVVIPQGAPYKISRLPISVSNGTISGETETTIVFSAGSVESDTITVTRTEDTTKAVTVDFTWWSGHPPSGHTGYTFRKSGSFPLEVIPVVNGAPQISQDIKPSVTAVHANYPNPFNPETWIPYQLAKPAEVTLTIYNMRGVVVRTIALGHRAAGVYTSRSRAIHWDGRNSIGEKVATGLYLYTLTAGDFSATRKMLIRK